MKPLRVAMVGVGGFGKYRRQRMRECGLFRIVAAYDINREALAECCREDGAQAAESFEALLDFPEVEALIISTGAKYHAEQALAALARGWHVFVEKPLCSTPDEAKALIKAQRQTGLVIGVGHCDHRHSAVSRTIKGLLDKKELGDIATFEKTTAHSGGLLIKPGDWRGDPDKNPGGMLFQCGVHGLHELMFYFGPISEVFCSMRYDINKATQTADIALCQLHFASGLIGTLHAYHVTPYRHTFNIFGTRANLYREERFFDEGTSLLIQRTRLDGAKEAKEPVPLFGEEDICGNLRSFWRAVRHGEPCYPGLREGVQAVAAVFAAEESAKSGRFVRISQYDSTI